MASIEEGQRFSRNPGTSNCNPGASDSGHWLRKIFAPMTRTCSRKVSGRYSGIVLAIGAWLFSHAFCERRSLRYIL